MGINFARVAPVLPVRDVTAALACYQKLGFEGKAYEEENATTPIYGFLSWGGIELHLARVPDLEPKTTTSACYLYVDDADALYALWQAAGVEGRFEPPVDTPYDLREFAYIDPDGNLLRVGSPLSHK